MESKMFNMSWSQRGHDIYIVLKRTTTDLDFEKVEVSLTDRSCVIRLPDGRKHGWNFFLEVHSKESHRIQSIDCLVIVVQKKDTTLYWPSFRRVPMVSHSILPEDFVGEKKDLEFNSQERHSNDGQPPSKMANHGPGSDYNKLASSEDMSSNNNNMKNDTSLQSGGTLMGGNRNNKLINSSNAASVDSEHMEISSSKSDWKNKHIDISSVKSDSYQTDDSVVVTLYIPVIDPWSIEIKYGENDVSVKFKTGDEKLLSSLGMDKNMELKLYIGLNGFILPDECKHDHTIKLLVLRMKKRERKMWSSVFKPKAKDLLPNPTHQPNPTTQLYHPPTQHTFDRTAINFSSQEKTPLKDKKVGALSLKKEKSTENAKNHGEGVISSKVCEPGYTGLINLGNTCFLNSVLQALANVDELKDFFLGRHYEADLNRKNPLGMGGKVAESFYGVVNALWSGDMISFAPKQLREVIGTRELRFNDFMQHDAQEFMAFLLDVLHEDLNRVHQKPYYEIKEGVGRNDHVVAEESWNLHKSRNDSKIVDLFHGLYKSRLLCPKCGKSSIKFDPFLFLPLPMPKLTRPISVFCQLSDPSLLPIKLIAQVHSERANAEEIFAQASKMLDVSQKNLRMFEVVESKLNRFFIPSSTIDDLRGNSVIFLQEALELEGNQQLDNQQQQPFYEVVVLQRRLAVHEARCCVYCNAVSTDQNDTNVKRCTKCLRVAYCNQQCQRADWPKHKFNCRRVFEDIGYPFIIRVPKFKWTFVDLCNNLTRVAMNRYVHVKFCRNVDGQEITPDQLPSTFDDFPLEFKPFEWSRMSNSSCLTPLHDQGNEPLDFSKIKFLAMDWLTEPTRQIYAVVEARQMEFSQVMETPGGTERLHLHDCMKLFTEPEVLAPEEAWYCPQCKRHEQATKELSLWSLPEVLIIQLKRFSFKNYLWRDKIDRFVDFPTSGLDMTQYGIGGEGSKSDCIYDLFAVVNHHGGILGGHYTCFVRTHGTSEKDNLSSDDWRLCDDSMVRRIAAKHVVSKAAYVMFYRKRKVKNTTCNVPTSFEMTQETTIKSPPSSNGGKAGNNSENSSATDTHVHQQQARATCSSSADDSSGSSGGEKSSSSTTCGGSSSSGSSSGGGKGDSLKKMTHHHNRHRGGGSEQQQPPQKSSRSRHGHHHHRSSNNNVMQSTRNGGETNARVRSNDSVSSSTTSLTRDMELGNISGERVLRYDEVFGNKGELVVDDINSELDSVDEFVDMSSSSSSSSSSYDSASDQLMYSPGSPPPLQQDHKTITGGGGSDEVKNLHNTTTTTHTTNVDVENKDHVSTPTKKVENTTSTVNTYTDMDAID